MRSISKVPYVVLTFYSTASYKTLDKWPLSLIVAEFYSAVYIQKGMEMCNRATFDALHTSTAPCCFSDAFKVQTFLQRILCL